MAPARGMAPAAKRRAPGPRIPTTRYGNGPYMIRQVKQTPIVLPSSIVLYDQAFAQNR